MNKRTGRDIYGGTSNLDECAGAMNRTFQNRIMAGFPFVAPLERRILDTDLLSDILPPWTYYFLSFTRTFTSLRHGM